jgi:hypothetical protein
MSMTAVRPKTLWTTIAVAMGMTLLAAVGFTLLFANRVSPLAFGAAFVWILLIIGLATGVVVFGLYRQGDRIKPGDTGLFLKAGAAPIACIFVFFSLVWLAIGHAVEKEAVVARIHWPVQFILLASVGFLIGRGYVLYKDRPSPEAQMRSKDNARRRDRLLSNLNELHGSQWLNGFESNSTGARLKAAISWWQEEIAQGLPARGPALGEEQVSFFLDDITRQVTALQDMMARQETNAGRLLEAERTVIEAISRTGRFARQLLG